MVIRGGSISNSLTYFSNNFCMNSLQDNSDPCHKSLAFHNDFLKANSQDIMRNVGIIFELFLEICFMSNNAKDNFRKIQTQVQFLQRNVLHWLKRSKRKANHHVTFRKALSSFERSSSFTSSSIDNWATLKSSVGFYLFSIKR